MDWSIQTRAKQCAATTKPFADGEVFYTLLLKGEDGFLRQDLCEHAWNQRAGDAEKPLSFWRSIFKEEPKEPDPLPPHDAETELRRLLEAEENSNPKLTCLLALLLERKKILRRQRQTVQDENGVEHVIYEHTQTQETFLIPQMEFSLSELDLLQDELASASALFNPLTPLLESQESSVSN